MTRFIDNWPGKLWCECCKKREATTSQQHPDLGINLSGQLESLQVCGFCALQIQDELELELEDKCPPI